MAVKQVAAAPSFLSSSKLSEEVMISSNQAVKRRIQKEDKDLFRGSWEHRQENNQVVHVRFVQFKKSAVEDSYEVVGFNPKSFCCSNHQFILEMSLYDLSWIVKAFFGLNSRSTAEEETNDLMLLTDNREMLSNNCRDDAEQKHFPFNGPQL
ncbi:hypothetical protein HPP92_026723 [Vanilla planifolia]|uniref:Uncharacterized protein n=1 Tax=Vanilla planifolia TaxID=51239 RepID=A0A835PEG3_VANPL|nr:hypothetical protein HPP92_026723 [Vanilla planifolia]